MKTKNISDIAFSASLLIITLFVFGLYLTFAAQNHFAQIEPIINGTAARPYIYRILSAVIVKNISHILGLSYSASAIILMCLSLIGFSFTMQAFTQSFLTGKYVKIITLLAPIGLIPLLIYQRHIYDFPTLFLTTLALYLLYKQEFNAYIVVFLLASLTKETSLLLIIFFVFHFRKIDKTKLVKLALIQIIVYVIVRLAIMFRFRNNSGTSIEFHFAEHITSYAQNPWLTVVLFSSIIILVIVAIRLKGSDSIFIKDALLTIGLPLLILYFISGVPFEIRIFFEIYPIVFLALVVTLVRYLEQIKVQHQSSTLKR